jgi:uncharacterized membrane protein (UPF0127 family)
MQMKFIYLAVAVFIVVVSVLAPQNPVPENPSQDSTALFHTSSGSVEVVVEIAHSPEERSQGLMFRESLPENSGMLFIFDEEAVRTFWMKNTLIPLDMIFIDSGMSIIHIEKDVRPCESDPCSTYSSQLPAQYVIEVNAGFSEKNSMDIGDSLEFSLSP